MQQCPSSNRKFISLLLYSTFCKNTSQILRCKQKCKQIRHRIYKWCPDTSAPGHGNSGTRHTENIKRVCELGPIFHRCSRPISCRACPMCRRPSHRCMYVERRQGHRDQCHSNAQRRVIQPCADRRAGHCLEKSSCI